ncbi:uncharacterized protein J4E79_006048 [Alternaria viburni]|uniref:uncharacterized protein n=1 Tax=Alternaria viburni TaxID=566460 RepID=UPI0020C3EE12|nr:uncharacterized protein J4E79_006048 [Alternaria viburni]KAI4659516.1 hypothetical protein J4E79_006048 [Alternaria viburni]
MSIAARLSTSTRAARASYSHHFPKLHQTASYTPYLGSHAQTRLLRSEAQTSKMTTASFSHIDTDSYSGKPWAKVDGPGTSFSHKWYERSVNNLRGHEDEFNTDNSGFAVYQYPAKEKAFTDDAAVRGGYYAEVEALLRTKLPGVKKVVIFDHTIRRRDKNSPRQPVQQVHVDQTEAAAEARVRRHLSPEEADEWVKGRYQIINVWRPIENPASDHPLAMIDWRTTSTSDFVATNLLYPKRADSMDVDDRGKEVLPDPNNHTSTEGYEVKGETMSVAANDQHKFYYQKDMTPEEVILLKCYDSFGEGMSHGKKGVAVRTPHTAFADPNTPEDAPGRQSIEVRCLVFYE